MLNSSPLVRVDSSTLHTFSIYGFNFVKWRNEGGFFYLFLLILPKKYCIEKRLRRGIRPTCMKEKYLSPLGFHSLWLIPFRAALWLISFRYLVHSLSFLMGSLLLLLRRVKIVHLAMNIMSSGDVSSNHHTAETSIASESKLRFHNDLGSSNMHFKEKNKHKIGNINQRLQNRTPDLMESLAHRNQFALLVDVHCIKLESCHFPNESSNHDLPPPYIFT